MKIDFPSRLSDAELVAEVNRCVRDERSATAHLVAHLAEFDARRLHLGAGYSSLFAYCGEVLGLSEDARYNRIQAARAARRFPVILERLADGSLNVTTVRLLARHLTGENHEELLRAAARRSKREVEELVARRFPRPDTPSSVRKVPERQQSGATVGGFLQDALPSPSDSAIAPPAAPPPSGLAPSESVLPTPPTAGGASPTPPNRPLITPLAADRYEVRFTMGAATRDKLKLARDLLRHAVPSGDPAAIFDRALTALIDEFARKKLAVVRKPRRATRPTAAGSRHVPARVKRAVWARDGGRCAFIGTGGHRCSERGRLEFHHVTPYAVGGEATVANIQLRCQAHNGYEAEVYYGPRNVRGGDDSVRESRPKYAVSWTFQPVPERVGVSAGRIAANVDARTSCRGLVEAAGPVEAGDG